MKIKINLYLIKIRKNKKYIKKNYLFSSSSLTNCLICFLISSSSSFVEILILSSLGEFFLGELSSLLELFFPFFFFFFLLSSLFEFEFEEWIILCISSFKFFSFISLKELFCPLSFPIVEELATDLKSCVFILSLFFEFG